MTTLGAALNSSAEQMRIDAAVADPADYYQIDGEVVQLLSDRQATPDSLAGDRTLWRVERGVAGTSAASHLNGATLTPLYPQIALSAVESGGGGVSVTDGVTTVAASTMTVPRVVDAGAGVAQLPGMVFLGLLKAAGGQTVPGGDQYTVITMASAYDPDGYYNANLPNIGIPGWKIPVGRAGVYRVGLVLNLLLTVPGAAGNFSVRPAIALNDLGDVLSCLGVLNTGVDPNPWASNAFTIPVAYTGELGEGEEIGFYVKQDSGDNSPQVLLSTHATLEWLADPL